MPKKPTRKPPRLTTEEATNQALAAAIAFAQPYGRVTEIAAKMSEITGEKVTRQIVGRWLAKNPKQRQQPTLGSGLVLLFAIMEIEGGQFPHSIMIALRKLEPEMKKLRRRK